MPDSTGELILSVVMITVPERKKQFHKLHHEVNKQILNCKEVHPSLGNAEIVEVNSKKFQDGGVSIGDKRQAGLNRSNGKYVCWLDDDDGVSPDYIETLLRLAQADADILVFNSFSRFDNFWCLIQMNLDFLVDEQAFPGIVHRRPWHVCPFKRELVKNIKFPSENWDEDTAFVGKALQKCKTQAKTEAVLHEYNRLTESYSHNNEKMRS